jgi:hypothetical protein
MVVSSACMMVALIAHTVSIMRRAPEGAGMIAESLMAYRAASMRS